MIDVEDFVLELEDDEEKRNFKLGKVVELFENDTAKIQFDGEETPSEKQYAYLGSYTPTIDDRVFLAVTGGTYIILGKVKFNEGPDVVEEIDRYLFDLKAVTILKGMAITGAATFNSGMSVVGNIGVNGNVMATGISATGAVTGASAIIAGELSAGASIVESLKANGNLEGTTIKGSSLSVTGAVSGNTVSASNKVTAPYLEITNAVSFAGLTSTSNMYANSGFYAKGTFAHQGSNLGFFGRNPRSRGVGDRYRRLASSASLSDVITKLNNYIDLFHDYGLSGP